MPTKMKAAAPKKKASKKKAAPKAKTATKTFDEWKAECGKVATTLLALDVLEEDDPYELFEAMPAAHAKGQSPEAFIREMFEEDLASQAHDEIMAREGEAYMDEEEVEDEGVEEEII